MLCVEEINLIHVIEVRNPNALVSGYEPVNLILITDITYEFICFTELSIRDAFHSIRGFFNSRSK